MSDKSGYVGRIKNGGTQVVKAPNQQTDAKKGVIHTGSDLRTGKKLGKRKRFTRLPPQGDTASVRQ